ncbi:FadR/GntR family transcriptional regulator [Megasphaera hominis]|jgi:GntR family transcriptional repressor for pyruvate dehydrogenase complex|uniref:FadR family transcriptional regulator n=1 Tax=Megasphaera hominis TaxID=159836 RepID=A0ABR6VJF3_9FIRM|nr:FadR/GntR family transcriptional regulator [Megasphaera hominis]MBC3536844.1 FadR family transcriptional regulator [Megasphaera hominis]
MSLFDKTDDRLLYGTQEVHSSADYVIAILKDALIAKRIAPGDKLPSETELARRFSVSRSSIREAIKILSAFGVVESKRGDGTYVAKEANDTFVFKPLLFSFILTQPDFRELQELRFMLEDYILQLVLQRYSVNDLQILEACNNQLKQCKERHPQNAEEILHYDLQFHWLLVRIAQNKLIEKIYIFVLDYFKPYIRRGIENPATVIEEAGYPHDAIIQAIKEKDPQKAHAAIRRSITIWKQLLTVN